RELKRKQLPNIPASKKLRPNDIHRIVQHTDNSIFDEEKCCLWTGYITNLKNKRKGTYINFYFKDKKKVALHRLLYANFKGSISSKDYIKYSCANKGKCCNINHMVRCEYNASDNDESDDVSDIESDDDDDENKGGANNNELNESESNKINKPTGGFPPIFIVDAKEKIVIQSSNRQLAPSKTAVSIKDILKNKK